MKNPTPSLPAFGNYNGTLDVSAAISAAFKGNKAIAVPLRRCRSRHNPPHSAAFRRIPPHPAASPHSAAHFSIHHASLSSAHSIGHRILTIVSNAFCREPSPSSPCAPSFRANFSCLGTDNFPRKHAFNSCRAVFHHPNAQELTIATARRFLPPQKACPRMYSTRVYYRND